MGDFKGEKSKMTLNGVEVKGLGSFSVEDLPMSNLDTSEFGQPTTFSATFTPMTDYDDLIAKYEKELDEVLIPGTLVRIELTDEILAIGKIGENRRTIVDVEFVDSFKEE